MSQQEIAQNLAKLVKTLGSQRVISEGEIQEVLKAIVTILAANKRGIEILTAEAKTQLEQAVDYIKTEHASVLLKVSNDITKTKAEIEKATKAQNDRAFKRLQTLITNIKLPKDGKDGAPGIPGKDGEPGKDGSPDSAEQVRDKLESLKDEDRLDASAIKGLEKFFGTIKTKGKEMLVGGVRFLEQLVDVAIIANNKREDLLIQYNKTTNRWEDGVAFTVSATPPSDPKVNDIWIDIS